MISMMITIAEQSILKRKCIMARAHAQSLVTSQARVTLLTNSYWKIGYITLSIITMVEIAKHIMSKRILNF